MNKTFKINQTIPYDIRGNPQIENSILNVDPTFEEGGIYCCEV